MTEKIIQTNGINPEALEALLAKGDLSVLDDAQRVNFIGAICKSVGLNPLTRPFDFMKTRDGKLIIYANKGCAEQLRSINKISVEIVENKMVKDVYVVTVKATCIGDGRVDTATGAVHIGRLQGEPLANAYMKAETKAKRRVTMSICGLNMLDESEAETIAQSKVTKNVTTQSVKESPPPQKQVSDARQVFTVGQLDTEQVATLINMAKPKGIKTSSTFNRFIEVTLGKINEEVTKEDYSSLFRGLTQILPESQSQGPAGFEEPPHPGS